MPSSRPSIKHVELNEALTRKIAHLARLELSEEETRVFTSQIQEVLSYVELLQEVEASGIEPMIHPIDLGAALREDQIRPSPMDAEGKPRVLESAPDVLQDGYKVPPIL